MNYYNDNDPVCCAWIEELIKERLIPDGKIDCRSIRDVRASDLDGFKQCHWFAGIAGWPLALQLAGWPEDEPVWSASCPCQPFSDAGLKLGEADERHLWPDTFRLIREVNPPLIFGEQVASKAALGWIDGVFTDLESEDYACAAADLCAPCAAQDQPEEAKAGAAYLRMLLDANHPSVRGRETEVLAAARELDGLVAGAPHIRQRLYWVAVAGLESSRRSNSRSGEGSGADCIRPSDQPGGSSGCAGGVADSDGRERSDLRSQRSGGYVQRNTHANTLRLAHPESGGLGADRSAPRDTGHAEQCNTTEWVDNAASVRLPRGDRPSEQQPGVGTGCSQGHWSTATWHLCTDGKARRIPSGSESVLQCLANGLPEGMDLVRLASSGFPLAPKIPNRSKVLKGYGNSIVPQLAVEFVKAVMESLSRH